MLGKKLYTLLENFSPKEQIDFKKYFDCAYFTSKTERKLMTTILGYHPDYLQASIDPEILYEQVFPATDFNYKKLKDLFADLVHQVEVFIAVNHLKKDRFQQKKLLALAYHQKADFRNFSKASNTALKTLEKESELYASYERLSIVNYQHYFLHEEKKNLSNSTLKQNNNLLNESFILNKLRLYNESFINKKIYTNQEIIALPFYEIVMKLAKKKRTTNALINLYFQLVILAKKATSSQFLIAYETFLNLQSFLVRPELAIAFTLLTNFTIARYQERDVSYLIYQFDLYKLGIANHLFTTSNGFSYVIFLNIVTTSIALKKIDFVEVFIKDTVPLLPLDERMDSKKLAWAYYHFYQKDYDKAGEIAAFLQSAPLVIAMRAFLIGLRSNFEYYLEDSDTYTRPFISICAKFERFFKSAKDLVPSKKEIYLTHLELIKEIASCMKTKKNQKRRLQAVLQKIDSTKTLVGWQYLRSRTNQLLLEH